MLKQRAGATEAELFLDAHPEIAAVDMLLPDMNGILRGKQLARDYLGKLYNSDGVRMPGSIYLLDSTGQNVTAYAYGTRDGDPDYLCHAVPGTLACVPWSKRPAAQVLASMYENDGAPFFADPRHVLAAVVGRLAELRLKPVVAIEYEFYLLDGEAAARGEIRPAKPTTPAYPTRQTNVGGMEDLADFEPVLADIHVACEAQSLPAETVVSEYAAGQFEINLHYCADALTACDQAILLERCIKQVARKHGIVATFMAKPFAEQAGSGLHVHVSLLDEAGRNVFGGPLDKRIKRPVSETMRHAIGGLIAAMPESMALFAPNANSYRRLRPGTYAPTRANWGGNNRTVSIRLPGHDDASARIEHRVAGADANPYLVTAAVLAGIHHGITHRLEPPPPVVGDAYAQEAPEMPVRWSRALDVFQQGRIIRSYLGDRYADAFATARRFECDNYHYQIQPLDYQWYLRNA
ncbi:glutamine synthetase family protein [Rhodoligotrophos defluvii]|uniref:glutamine synthetase family protein n=1 Tax=Rhodoligotrophos defluvii TaxID=2561934 RepID=UPI0010CA03DA|nr:glutamine synthetase family protein [Rhodoligotrophos defluvii]